MALPVIIAGVAAAVAAAPEVIEEVKKLLDALGVDRSCIVEVVNTTDERLKLVRSGHDSGGYQQPPAPFLEPRTTMVFTSHSTAAGRGAVGNIGLQADNLVLLIDYSNPFIGENDLDASLEGARAREFAAFAEAGPGNTNARLRCVLSYADESRYDTGPVSRFRSHNFADRYIRHRNFLGELTPDGAPVDDFKFAVVSRGPDLVALRSVNFPGRYIRHQDFVIKLQGPAGPNDTLWTQDTTFRVENGLADKSAVSLRSVNYPDRYIRHRDFKLYLESGDADLFKADATFHRTAA